MSSCRKVSWRLAAAATALMVASLVQAQSNAFPGIGRPATPKEIAAWDIDVRPDFKGLPKGSGTVSKGMEVWESKCSSCHGIFGESNEFFSPLIGGTTKEDIKTGRAARLNDPSFPGRTTMMKVPTLSTLWDYVNRAMPWTQPKSLSTEEVYAVVAYMLNMAGIVPDDFKLSDANMAEVQQRLPNRNGMTTEHAMWPGASFGNRKPDVQAVACMKDCGPAPTIASDLPDFARNAHGNLAEQNRIVGPQRGANTEKPAPATLAAGGAQRVAAAAQAPAAAATKPAAGGEAAAAIALTAKYSCNACHGLDNKIIGPSFRDIAGKQGGRADAVAYLTGKIKAGGSGVYGPIPMPPQSLGDADAKAIAQWIAAGAKK
ncbi:c-type cytochrome [Piscinibacter sakaiensis]|uniref:c-type cytochrome n=1 Tax=Piscinibacter sakaiensis TaxID=1547922 RepID=UPI003AAF3042